MGAIPTNHKLAERKLIVLVRSGEWEIDEYGQIWRNAVRRGLRNGGSRLVSVERRRVERPVPSGYLLICATINGKRITGLAHRLVWQHYHGDIPDGMVINHKNGLKDDCRPDNLIPSTYSDNNSHAHQNGLLDQYGQKNPAAKLTDREVAQIRLAYANGGYTMEQLGNRFGVSFKTISKIVKGQRRAKQGGPILPEDHHRCVCEKDPVTGRFIGKKKAGRLLDGRLWDEHPK